jgi:hypothetical protein
VPRSGPIAACQLFCHELNDGAIQPEHGKEARRARHAANDNEVPEVFRRQAPGEQNVREDRA